MASAFVASLHNIHWWTDGRLTERQVGLTRADQARFWAKIQRGSDEACWLWQASVTGTGSVKHGQFTVTRPQGQMPRQAHLKAHRVAWELHHGEPIPYNLCVCHHCDEPRCCNPRHLFLGTQQDNIDDAYRKGRFVRRAKSQGVLQHEAGQSEPCLSPTDLVHQILQPVPSRQLPIVGEVS